MRWMTMMAAAMLAAPVAATAAQPQQDSPFGVAPVADAELAGLRGGQSPFARLTRGTAARLVDDYARADLRLTGGMARVEMDVWWGSIGAELIATSVRSAGD